MPPIAKSLFGLIFLTVGGLLLQVAGYLPAVPAWIPFSGFLFLVYGLFLAWSGHDWRGLLVAVPLALLASLGIRQILWPAGVGNPVDRVEAVPAALPWKTEKTRVRTGERWQAVWSGRGRELEHPAGWEINLFAAGLGPVRMLAFGPAGQLYASVPKQDLVVVLPDRNGDGEADAIIPFVAGLPRPHGLGWYDGALYVAGEGILARVRDADGNLQAEEVRILSTDVPGAGGHWTRSLAVGGGGEIYLASGSTCNACEEEDKRRAAILRFAPGAAIGELFAVGLRNAVGLALHPETGALWASENGRDLLGDDLPPDEINLVRKNRDYGWPFCFGDRIPDSDLGDPQRCSTTEAAAVELQAHSAPLGISFANHLGLGEHYDSALLVASHGSWNRTVPTGYKVLVVPFRDGRPIGSPVDLVRGWLVEGQAWGRPVSPVVGPDGAIYLSDDYSGAIYRITHPTRGGPDGDR